MRIYARLVEYPLDVVIERPQHADVRVHQRPATFRRHDQSASTAAKTKIPDLVEVGGGTKSK